VKPLRVIVIGPNDQRRRAVAEALGPHQVTLAREYMAYPSGAQLALDSTDWDIAALDLDSDAPTALGLVAALMSRNPGATVMVYSRSTDQELLMRCMWAGAREFLNLPLSARVLAEALTRAATRKQELEASRKSRGKILVFAGVKGGVGTTTLAANFTVALRREAGVEPVLVDLDVELGDASVLLGVKPSFTIIDALRNPKRLDGEFVAGMLARHDSGWSAIAGPDQCDGPIPYESADLAVLLNILREQFAYLVVDAGSALGRNGEALVEAADKWYLISQVDVLGLRNTQRYIMLLQRLGVQDLEVALNRFDPRRNEISEDEIVKFLGVPIHWRIPNDYHVVRQSHNTGTPLALGDSVLARVIAQMARSACGKPATAERRKAFSMFAGLAGRPVT
jgi:pilus assembly protein CpaE